MLISTAEEFIMCTTQVIWVYCPDQRRLDIWCTILGSRKRGGGFIHMVGCLYNFTPHLLHHLTSFLVSLHLLFLSSLYLLKVIVWAMEQTRETIPAKRTNEINRWSKPWFVSCICFTGLFCGILFHESESQVCLINLCHRCLLWFCFMGFLH